MSNTLLEDNRLLTNGQLTSNDGRFTLVLQTDGNLVLYTKPISVETAYWASGTADLPAEQRPNRLEMQRDAHLVLYDRDGVARWASGTWGLGFVDPRLVLQDDGNLVIYHRGEVPVWATGTPTGDGRIQARGNINPGGPSPTITVMEHTNLGSNHFMDTTARLHRSGHIDATTRTQTGTWLGGFTGGVNLLFVDEQEIVIGSTQTHTFGVDGTILGRSDRSDFWTDEIDAGIAERTQRVVILHYWAPKWNAINTLLGKAVSVGQQLVPFLALLKQVGLI